MANKPKSLIEELMRGFWWILVVCGLFVVGILYLEFRFDDRLRYRLPDAAATVDYDVESDSPASGQQQAVYVPAYSHVYHQDGRPLLLTVTLSVRNTDRDHEIALSFVFGTEGCRFASHHLIVGHSWWHFGGSVANLNAMSMIYGSNARQSQVTADNGFATKSN